MEKDGFYVLPSFKFIKNNDPELRHTRRKPVPVTEYFSYHPINEIGVRLESLIALVVRYRPLVPPNQTNTSKPWNCVSLDDV